MAESLIYVAGNPSLYPIEYYDRETDSYQGVIPKLLEQFSEESGYEIRYYEPGKEDQRAQMAANRQVDVISGCTGEEDFQHVDGQGIVLLEAEEDGEEISYQLFLTDVAPADFETECRQFFSEISQSEKTGLLMEVQEEQGGMIPQGFFFGALGCSVVLLLLLAVSLVMLRKLRKHLRFFEEDRMKDSLTGLANAESFRQLFAARVNENNRILYSVCCFYVDTDHMARVIGYEDTDRYLQHAAAVLKECVSETEALAYITNIGFVVLRWSGGEIQEEWILSALHRIGEFSEESRVSAGIYSLKEDDSDADQALFNAYAGAVTAYRNGELYCICTDEVLRAYLEEKRLREDLKGAFEREEFQLYLQFYVDAHDTGRIVGGEALTRWQHPERGFLLPSGFIPIMEREGLIPQMDYYMLKKACDFLERLHRDKIEDFYISCNISRVTFEEPSFAERCKEIVEKYRFRKSLLILELTEGLPGTDSSGIRRNAAALREYGVRLALDDFGEGFTSFFDLQEYPTDYLKLDKSLVDNVGSQKGMTILRTMVTIGHELGMTVMAEGIETEQQLQKLQNVHCDVIQGFYFYHPVPEWDAEKQILRKRAEEQAERKREKKMTRPKETIQTGEEEHNGEGIDERKDREESDF